MKRLIEIADGRWAHASGAMWLPDMRTVLIADAHLGYGWAQRRRGELGPVRDDTIASRLVSLLDELAPLKVVFLGDLVHAPRPAPEERKVIVEILESAATRAELVIVRGNHDRGFVRDFGISTAHEWRAAGLLAVHGDRLPPAGNEHLLTGHFHPVFSPRDAAGAKQRIPVFVFTERATILPAFSPFAAGCDLGRNWSPELEAVLGAGTIRLAACTGRNVVPLPFRRPRRKILSG